MRGATVLLILLAVTSAHADDIAETPTSCLNDGREAYREGRLPGAIASFRRGLEIDPHDPALRSGLAYLRTQVVYPSSDSSLIEEESWYSVCLSESAWLGIAFVSFCVFCVGATLWQRCKTGLAPAFVGLLLTIAALVPWVLIQHDRSHALPVAVIAEETTLRTGNSDLYAAVSALSQPLRPGVEARQLGTRGGWVHLRFANGLTGWVRRSSVV